MLGCPSKHLDSPELTRNSLFLLHNLQVYEPPPRLQVSPKDTRRRKVEEGEERERGREGCLTSERAATDKETVKGMVGRSRRGRVERRGGRWREIASGALGKGRRMERRRNREGRRQA